MMLLGNWLSQFGISVKNRTRRLSSHPTRQLKRPFRSHDGLGAIVESLESRQLLTALVVTLSTDPTGAHTGESLRDAINTANAAGSGDTITFSNSLAGQTISLTQGELQITGSMTITGLGAGQLTIDAGFASRIFDVDGNSPQTVSISGLTIENGGAQGLTMNGYGGAIFNQASLTLSGDVFYNNRALGPDGNGGAIYNSNGALSLIADTFLDNYANISGGAIFNASGTLNAIGDTYSDNTGFNGQGGAIYNGGTFISTNDTVIGNADYGAGGIYNSAGSTLTMTNDTITGNFAQGVDIGASDDIGGGVYNGGTVNMLNTIIVGNTEPDDGDFYGALPTSMSANNLTSIGSGETLANILQTVLGSSPLQPQLANNGGATQTVALAAGSPADNAGGALTHVSSTGDGGTKLTVANTTFIAVGDYLRIGSEIVLVTAVNSATTFSVTRAQAGTTQTNLDGLAVNLAYDQRGFARSTNDVGAVMQSNASPKSILVTIGGDTPVAGYTDLRQAILQADLDNGDTISFAGNLAGQTIMLSQGELPIISSMTIEGRGGITIDGNSSSRIFDISGSASQNVVISGLTLQHGNGSGTNMSGNGGAIYNTANLTLTDDFISINTANNGGAIYNNGTLTATNDTFSNNAAAGNGGGIFQSSGSIALSNDTISGNSASYGGGILNGMGATMTSNSDTISGNNASGYGAGIYSNGAFSSTNDTISSNSATGGGGILNYINGTLTLTNDTISGNSANNDFGGGIYNGGALNWINTILVGNMASNNADFYGTLPTSGSNNLTSIPTGQILSNVLQTIPGSSPLRPMLGSNGGPTQTVLLEPGSVAAGSGASLTTLTGSGLSSTSTTATVASSTFIAVGDTIKIDNEIMTVTGISGTTLILLRGQFGTTAAAHSANAAVYLGTDQRGVTRVSNDIGSTTVFTPTVYVYPSGGSYTGNPYPVTSASVLGVGGQQIASLSSVTFAYYAGTLSSAQIASATPLSSPPTNVGSYTVVGTFTSNLAGYTNATSQPAYFTITPGAASKLVFSQATPTSGTAGVKLGSSVAVSVEDAFGNVVTSNSSQVTISIASGPAGATFAAGSILTANVVGGVATFSNLIFDTAGTYTLKVKDGSLATASFNVTIVHAAPSQLAFISVPGTGKVGHFLPTAVKVAVEDAFGNLCTTNSTSITISVNSGPKSGGLVAGTNVTVKAVDGIATFAGLKFTKAGTYKLKVSDGNLATSTSTGIVIS